MKWPRKRVWFLAATIFAVQIFAIFALHTPAPMVFLPDTVRSPRPRLDTTATNAIIESDALNDPLVFAGAHQHGFSAYAWMMQPRPEYQLTNSAPPPRFLTFTRKPTDFDAAASHSASRDSDLPFVQFDLPKINKRSVVRLEGQLTGRRLLHHPEIPIQYATDVLTNTVVQVAVQADGFPFSARIITGSGSHATDLAALEIVNRSRFAPLPPLSPNTAGDLQWGELVFQWFTTEPVATNTPAKTAISAAK